MSQTVEFRKCKDGSLDYGHYRRVAQRLRSRAVRAFVRGSVSAAARALGFGRRPEITMAATRTAINVS